MYKNEIMDAMTKKFGYKNVMEVLPHQQPFPV